MGRTKLFQKFLAAFSGFILIPFMLLLGILLLRSNNLQLKNDQAQNENLAAQTVNTIRRQSELAQDMCEAVSQNQNLVSFLDKPYEPASDLLYYTTTIRDFVKITNGVSDIRLHIYLANDSIPPGFGIFYSLGQISGIDALQSFLNDPLPGSMWLSGTFDQNIRSGQSAGEDKAYHYFYKMMTGSRLTGVIDAVIPEDSFEIVDALSMTELDPAELPGACLYNFSGSPLENADMAALAEGPDAGYNRDFVYSRKTLPAGPFDVIVVSPRSRLTFPAIALTLLLPALFLIMMAGFFTYNRRMIRDLHLCLDSMELAIRNHFLLPAPGTPHSLETIARRNDEISTLAVRISYLLKQIRTLLAQQVSQQTAAKEAELLALQHQINPHFLYNTMEVFSSRMELAGLYEESDAISAFCRMLRYNINTKDLMTTLRDEIRQVEYYLSIQKIRDIPFTVDFAIPDHLLCESSIRFLLEPFVENSFKYRRPSCPLHISISAAESEDEIELCVCNNGEPIPPERTAELNERFRNSPATMKTNGEHIGLNNINSRLKLFYGSSHYIRVECDNVQTMFRFSITRRPLAAPDEAAAASTPG